MVEERTTITWSPVKTMLGVKERLLQIGGKYKTCIKNNFLN